MIRNASRDGFLEIFSPFSDIGDQVKITEQADKFTVRMSRDGRPLRIVIDAASGKVQTTWGGAAVKNHASVASALGSEIFGNIRKFADSQNDLLKKDAVAQARLIPINGRTHDAQKITEISEIDERLGANLSGADCTEILLIDGPAGIGKTNLIEQLALHRASNYRASGRAPILHVKSRGRVLSNIQDLMAFSLQTLRSNVTYDQVPILVRYGLIVLAIDGFDELGDPNGYETAWAQLGDLVNFVRGSGTLILSGRDTFVGRDRLMQDVHAIQRDVDVVSSLTLGVPSEQQAKTWLKHNQWSDVDFASTSISVLLEEGSFALRPVFLRLLGEHVKPKQIRGEAFNYLVSMLVNHMVSREAGLFGKPVDGVMSLEQRKKYIVDFMHEAAREMADSQTESLDAGTISWIAEAALGGDFPPDITGLIKNRANVLAFLVADERPGYKRFINLHLMNFFLAQVTIDVVGRGEIPKYLRRNLFATEFLSVFYDVATEVNATQPEVLRAFLDKALWIPQRHIHADRGVRNVGALIMALLPFISNDSSLQVGNFDVDDCIARGTAAELNLVNVSISQLDCRQADLSSVKMENVRIAHLIADDTSRFSPSFPAPRTLTVGQNAEYSDSATIEAWLDAHGRNQAETRATGLATLKLIGHPVYRLLGRACRVRQYWLRAEDDIYGTKILLDREWPLLKSVLERHGFLREEVRQASGRSSTFYHIRQPDRILAEDRSDLEIVEFYEDLNQMV